MRLKIKSEALLTFVRIKWCRLNCSIMIKHMRNNSSSQRTHSAVLTTTLGNKIVSSQVDTGGNRHTTMANKATQTINKGSELAVVNSEFSSVYV